MFSSTALLDILSIPFKRSQLGLFHGKTKLYGNNVPFSKKKTRRTWLPNIQNKRLFSETLQETMKLKLTTRAMKTMKKYGGFDNYVLKTKHQLLGWEGMRLRVKLHEAQAKDNQAKDTISFEKNAEAKSPGTVSRKERTISQLRKLLCNPEARATFREELKAEVEERKEKQRVRARELLRQRKEMKKREDIVANSSRDQVPHVLERTKV